MPGARCYIKKYRCFLRFAISTELDFSWVWRVIGALLSCGGARVRVRSRNRIKMNVRRATLIFCLCSLVFAISKAPAEQTKSAADAWIELVGPANNRNKAFRSIDNDPALPNVLLYGDSISMHYTATVRAQLAGKANVYRIYCNGRSVETFVAKMAKMRRVMRDATLLDPWSFSWDVVHFNAGLHDLKYVVQKQIEQQATFLQDSDYGKLNRATGERVNEPTAYAEHLHDVVHYVRRIAPHATLIFATTTPIPEGAPGRGVGDARHYNDVALGVFAGYPDVVINDLYAFATTSRYAKWWQLKNGNVHFGLRGRRALGKRVARVVGQALQRRAGLK